MFTSLEDGNLIPVLSTPLTARRSKESCLSSSSFFKLQWKTDVFHHLWFTAGDRITCVSLNLKFQRTHLKQGKMCFKILFSTALYWKALLVLCATDNWEEQIHTNTNFTRFLICTDIFFIAQNITFIYTPFFCNFIKVFVLIVALTLVLTSLRPIHSLVQPKTKNNMCGPHSEFSIWESLSLTFYKCHRKKFCRTSLKGLHVFVSPGSVDEANQVQIRWTTNKWDGHTITGELELVTQWV